MPSAEYPQDTYTSYLKDVEHLISQLNTEGTLLIMGDLNRPATDIGFLYPDVLA